MSSEAATTVHSATVSSSSLVNPARVVLMTEVKPRARWRMAKGSITCVCSCGCVGFVVCVCVWGGGD